MWKIITNYEFPSFIHLFIYCVFNHNLNRVQNISYWINGDKWNGKDVECNTVHSENHFDISLKEQKKSTKTLVRVAILQVDIGTCDLPDMKQ